MSAQLNGSFDYRNMEKIDEFWVKYEGSFRLLHFPINHCIVMMLSREWGHCILLMGRNSMASLKMIALWDLAFIISPQDKL